jgi:hypothetical protein
MMDDRFDDWIEEAARDYNAPPEPPREAMWEAIAAARTGNTPAVRPIKPARRVRPIWALPLAAAALLLIGIEVGRMSRDTSEPGTVGAVATTGSDSAPARQDSIALPRQSGQQLARQQPESEPASAAAARLANQSASRNTGPAGERLAKNELRSERSDRAYQMVIADYLAQSETFLSLFRTAVTEGRDDRLAPATARQLLATNRLLLDSPAAHDPATRNLLQELELVLAQISQLSADSSRGGDVRIITDGLDQNDMMLRLRAQSPARVNTIQGVL